MTEKELNRLKWINKELIVLMKQLADLKSKSYIKGQEITDMPSGSGTSDKTADRAIAIQEIETLYEIKLKELYLVRGQIERYINTIEDDRIRLIVRLKCINGMEWEEIGKEVGYHRTRVSQLYRDYIKEQKDSHNSHVNSI